jgi:hypothetical protein
MKMARYIYDEDGKIGMGRISKIGMMGRIICILFSIILHRKIFRSKPFGVKSKTSEDKTD